MLHYTFVILHIFIYYACTSYAAVPAGVAVSSNGTKTVNQLDKNCTVLKKEVYLEKNKCLQDFLSGNSKDKSNCTDVSSVKKYFVAEFKRTAHCYELAAYRQMINESLHLRLALLEKVMKDGKVKKFFDNGGLECIKATKGPINEECIFSKTGIDPTKLENSIVRQRALFTNKATHSRGEKILKCIEKHVNKTCPNPILSMDFIISIHKPMLENYDAMNSNRTDQVIAPKSNVTGIIIGCLVALIVVLLVTLFFIKKYGKRSDSQNRQSQSYNVSFQQNNAESRTKG